MHKNSISIILIGLLYSCPSVSAQDTVQLSLGQVLEQALEQAIDLRIAKSEATEQDMAFERARLTFKPQLFLDATLPNLNRSIESRALPDGSDAFVNRSTMYNGIGLQLNYPLEEMGGTLSLTSRFERLDVFKTSQFDYQKTYFVNPITIEYKQPISRFNELRWQKERLSLLYAEFKERYARVREDIILQAVQLFRSCFLAQQKVQLATQKIIETDSLFLIKSRLFDIGHSTRGEMLRLELDQKNNRLNLDMEALQWNQFQLELADFVGASRAQRFLLEDPDPFKDIRINWQEAMTLAVQNDVLTSQNRSRYAEAKANLDRAKKQKDIDFSLKLSLGLNSTGAQLQSVFNPLLDKEIFSASIRMPVTGWKRYELQEKIAQEQIIQEDLKQEKEQIDLGREAFNLVTTFELLKQSLQTKEESLATADEILALTRSQFLVGSATHTDITVSSQEREKAVLAYYDSLLEIVDQYYQIRRICMYDFENDRPLASSLE